MAFSAPWMLLLLFPAWALLFYFWLNRTKTIAADIPTLAMARQLRSAKDEILVSLPLVLRLLAIFCLILAVAKPYVLSGESVRDGQGLNIMMAIDVSGSMRALDFEYDGERMDRLEVIKRVVRDFISTRKDDRLGMVLFGDEAFTQVPLTLDHAAFLSFLDQVRIAQAGHRTAIGDGIALSLKRLLEADEKSRLVILLTDGANNSGEVAPMEAAQLAKTLGIPVYTIGVATHGQAPFLEDHSFFGRRIVYHESDIDEDILREISNLTGGAFYRAIDSKELKEIYSDIESRETSRFEVISYNERIDVYFWFVWPGFIFFVFEMLMMVTRWWKLP